MSKKLNIGYFADGPWSHEAFKKLISDNGISIRFVCVRFDSQDVILKQYCKKMRLNTNGSGKKLTWWQDYYDIISDTDETVFGIDGLEDTSDQYRINQDWKSSFDALKLGAKLGKTVIWQWIPFSFNEHQIDEARALANRYNIPFMILKSSRWKPNDELMPTNRNLYVDYFENYDI